jgi:hypothetical protein
MVLNTIKTSFVAGLIVSCILGFSLYQNGLCAEAVSVKDGLVSVNLKDSSLLEVARDIEKQSGVWFRGDETLFQEKISVSFNDLPLEEGLKRILANLNYSLMFDAKNNVAGVMVMGEGTPAGAQPGRPGTTPSRVVTPPRPSTRPAPTVRPRPSTSTPRATTARRPPRVVLPPAQGGTASQSPGASAAPSALPDAFKVQENDPAPGGPAASDGPLPPAFRETENAPPQGAPTPDKEMPAASKIIRNAQPPGGTTQAAGVGPGGSAPAKNTSSSGEEPKSETPP